MYRFRNLIIWAGLANSFALGAFAQSTAFTYQGWLNDGAKPANGIYDLRFGIYDAATSGNQQGYLITNSATAVSSGLFTVMLDFGDQFPGASRWLDISVRTNGGGAFVTLAPRQALASTPYSIQSANASSAASANSVAAGNITGTLNAAQLPAGVVTNGATGVNLSGTFSGNGAGVTNVGLNNINTGGGITPGNLVLASSPAVGEGPLSVAAADVNGKVDLISANNNASTLSVLTNVGNGQFVLASSLADVTSPTAVVAVSRNGNGGVLLIAANSSPTLFPLSGTLSEFTNNDATGGFGLLYPPQPQVFPPIMNTIVAADLNDGAGNPDLIIPDALFNQVDVVSAYGGYPSMYNVGSSPCWVTAADVNSDGKLDIISANSGANTLSVLTNDGSGGFVLASSPPVGSRPIVVVAADVNGDGKVDLISANSGDNTLSVLTNDGSGGFVTAFTIPVDSGLSAMVAAEVGWDGAVDLICANTSSNTLSVLVNNGGGEFVPASSTGVGIDPVAVTAADVNGDGLVDFITANQGDNTLSVLINEIGFNGSGNNLISLNASQLTGTLPGTVLSGTYSSAVTFSNSFNGFTGDGSGLVNLNASQLTSGTVPGGALGGTYSGAVIFNNPANSFTGNGSGLTSLNLNASQLTGGPVPDAVLSTNVALRSTGNTLTGDQIITNGSLYSYGTVSAVVIRPANTNYAAVTEYDGTNNTSGFRAFVGADGTGITGIPNQMFIGSYSSHPVKFFTGHIERMAIDTSGNVGIGISSPTNKLHVIGGATFSSGLAGLNQNVVWVPGSASWSFTSDRNTKEHIAAVDTLSVLEKVTHIPINEWSYIGYDQRHIGPMAQDFHAQFPLNESDTSLNDADLHGVALAAIQGLNQKIETGSQSAEDQIQKLETENREFELENAELEARLEKLERLINSETENSK